VWRFDLAREAFDKAGDLGALMLLLLAVADRDGLKALAAKAGAKPVFFICCGIHPSPSFLFS